MTSRRVPAPVIIGLLLAAALLGWIWLTWNTQSDPETGLASLPAAPSPSAQSTAAPPTGPLAQGGLARGAVHQGTGEAFAEVEGLVLQLPDPQTILVAFHEASRAEALALTPLGQLMSNDNPSKFSAGEDVAGPPYRVLTSRGRPRPATSAADLVLPTGATVSAPVSGTVTEVLEYSLYGRLQDWRVVISPAGRPELAVVVIHLESPAVAVGEHVQAGVSALGTVRELPFGSHVDDYLDEPHPHAHLEVKAAVAPELPDPNVPAAQASEDLDIDL